MVRVSEGGGGGVHSYHRYAYSMVTKARVLALIGKRKVEERGVIFTAMEAWKGGL